jgi:hypothetical protein
MIKSITRENEDPMRAHTHSFARDEKWMTDLEKATLLRHRADVLLKESRELLHEAEALEKRAKYLTGEEVERGLRPMLRITHSHHGAKAEVHH